MVCVVYEDQSGLRIIGEIQVNGPTVTLPSGPAPTRKHAPIDKCSAMHLCPSPH
jgi:hypothetical protein